MKMSLKMCAITALFMVGMSSCLKNDSLGIYVRYPYVLQNGYGTFTPQIRLVGSNLASASVQIAGGTFPLTKVNDFIWELNENNPSFLPLVSITNGYYMLTATGLNGKTETLEFALSEASKQIYPVNLTTLEYSEKTMKVELADSVQNANAYFLMVKLPTNSDYTSYSMWIPYSQLDLTGDKKLSATVSIPDLGKERYRFAVGANYGSVVRISEKMIAVENDKQVE